ncbi:MAG: RNA polymerase sigma factor [Bacteroidales bacterium]|nr:RNA polymerase sigma factor [Bacteroidales bacterium]
MTDDALVRRCLSGDPTAMRTLVERFQADVFALSVRILHHRQDAEDATQEVFVRVFRSLHHWDASRPLRPWIQTIAVNRCRTWLGKRSKQPQPVEHLNLIPDRPESAPPSELVQGIAAAVEELRADYREVFVLFHEQGQSYEEIAMVLDRPVGTVKTWLHRARNQVLETLRQAGLVPQEPTTSDRQTPEPTRSR